MTEILDYPLKSRLPIPNKLILQGDSNQNAFHVAMKMPITIMQVFGFLPVHGVRGPNYRSLEFRWISWKVLYSVASIVGYIFNFAMYWCNHPVDNILEINAIMFHTITILLSILFVNLAIKWPDFVKEWHSIEMTMKSYELPVNLKRKIVFIAVGIICLASVEHFMVMGNRLYKCYQAKNGDTRAAWRDFYLNELFNEVFKTLPYSAWAGVILQFMIIQKTFIWTFVDVFIGTISICLTYKLKQICKKLEYLVKVEVSNMYVWRAIRKDYIKIARLGDSVNDHLSWFIMISYISNLFFILTQLFSSLRPKEESVQKIYFYLSFFLLNLRLITVCVFGGAVNDQYSEIVRILTSVPSRVYNIEVASAIVTYELVLIQFNEQDFKNKNY